jgi:hypothetical protein
VAALEGRVVHDALEELVAWAKRGEGGTPFDARRFMKSRLREVLRTEVAGNPRLNAGRLEAGFSLDECLHKFYALAGVWTPPLGGRPAPPPARPAGPPGPPDEDAERWVERDDPPLAGRIDRVSRGGIIDFKTGEPDPEAHREQLLIYALLWWLEFRARPAGLTVRYATGKLEVPVPSEVELSRLAEALRAEIRAACDLMANPPPPARPGVEACRFCPVRQLCDAYWTSPQTLPLRSPPLGDAGDLGGPPLRDVRIAVLPEHWRPGQHLHGAAEAEGIGAVRMELAARYAPGPGEPKPRAVRLLHVLLVREEAGWLLRPTASTEAFWEAQQE